MTQLFAQAGRRRLEIYVKPNEKLIVHDQLRATIETSELVIRLRVTFDGTQPVIDHITFDRKDDAPPIPNAVMVAVGLGDILRHVVEQGAERWKRNPADRRQWIHQVGEVGGTSLEVSPAFRRGRRADPERFDAEIQRAADVWVDAVEQGHDAPVTVVMDALNVSRRTATRRLAEARARGLLD